MYVLQPLCYNFVSRSAKQFVDDVEWVYHCTCDLHTLQLSTSLNSVLQCKYLDYLMKFPRCLHIQAVIHACSQLDAIHCISPAQHFQGMKCLDYSVCKQVCLHPDHTYVLESIKESDSVSFLNIYHFLVITKSPLPSKAHQVYIVCGKHVSCVCFSPTN